MHPIAACGLCVPPYFVVLCLLSDVLPTIDFDPALFSFSLVVQLPDDTTCAKCYLELAS